MCKDHSVLTILAVCHRHDERGLPRTHRLLTSTIVADLPETLLIPGTSLRTGSSCISNDHILLYATKRWRGSLEPPSPPCNTNGVTAPEKSTSSSCISAIRTIRDLGNAPAAPRTTSCQQFPFPSPHASHVCQSREHSIVRAPRLAQRIGEDRTIKARPPCSSHKKRSTPEPLTIDISPWYRLYSFRQPASRRRYHTFA